MKNFTPHLNFVAALPCKTNTSMNVVLLRNARFQQNITKKVSKGVDRIKAINKFKGYVRSVLPMHEHKLLSLQCQLSIAMSTIDCSRPQ